MPIPVGTRVRVKLAHAFRHGQQGIIREISPPSENSTRKKQPNFYWVKFAELPDGFFEENALEIVKGD